MRDTKDKLEEIIRAGMLVELSWLIHQMHWHINEVILKYSSNIVWQLFTFRRIDSETHAHTHTNITTNLLTYRKMEALFYFSFCSALNQLPILHLFLFIKTTKKVKCIINVYLDLIMLLNVSPDKPNTSSSQCWQTFLLNWAEQHTL